MSVLLREAREGDERLGNFNLILRILSAGVCCVRFGSPGVVFHLGWAMLRLDNFA
jgi:hypothetical protein